MSIFNFLRKDIDDTMDFDADVPPTFYSSSDVEPTVNDMLQLVLQRLDKIELKIDEMLDADE
jgi:hypothetical protein